MPGGLFFTRPCPLLYSPGSSVGLFFQSDPHFGASDVDYDLLDQERKKVLKRGDRLCVNGDVFDAILTRDTKRYEPTKLHKSLQGRNDLLNGAIDMAYSYYAPLASRIDMIGTGNHESALEKHHNVDPISLLVKRLNQLPDTQIAYGGYAGFVQYSFQDKPQNFQPQKFTVFYWHGSGGGNSLASSASEFEKKGFIEGADVFWIAHKHTRMAIEVERLSCPPSGHKPVLRKQWNIRTGSYFKTYEGQSPQEFKEFGRLSNFAADALLPPQGRGGIRLVLTFDRKTGKRNDTKVELYSS